MRRRRGGGALTDQVDDSGCRAEFAAAVRSAVGHLDFQVRCTVVWEGGPAVRPYALWDIAERTCSTLRRYQPTHWQLAGIQLAADLAEPMDERGDTSASWHARNVTVVVDDQHLVLAREHAARQRELVEEAWAADHAELRYLKEMVFADPDMTAMWWLRHNKFNLAQAESTAAALRGVMRTIAGVDTPHWTDQLCELVGTAVGSLPRAREVELYGRLATLLDDFGAREEAVQLRERSANRAVADSSPASGGR